MFFRAILIGLALTLGGPANAAVTFTTIFKFSGTDGAGGLGPLFRTGAGVLFGATTYGGITSSACPVNSVSPGGCGTVFRLTPPAPGKTAWARATLYKFKGGADGKNPFNVQILNGSGALVGTTVNGGATSCEGGCGNVYKLTPPAAGQTAWTKTVLYPFNGTDGSNPYGSLLLDPSGALFGTTYRGVPQPSGGYCFDFRIGCGSVFKLTPPAAGQTKWVRTLIYAFKGGADGALPIAAGLMRDSAGKLYGTTAAGGDTSACPYSFQISCGVVYRLTPPVAGQTKWLATTLYAFKGGTDGDTPYTDDQLLRSANGVLYGATLNGGAVGFGTIFSLTPPAAGQTKWTKRILYSFKGGADGAQPYAGLVSDASGALYGTAGSGGSSACTSGCGLIFKLTPPAAGHTAWTKTLVHNFTGADGARPVSRLIPGGTGIFYGMTNAGGSNVCPATSVSPGGCGTIFKLTL
jgi:uncharacterized repeat protein (TIGR03803 family)